MKRYDFRCENNHVFEVCYDSWCDFHRDDRYGCPECGSIAEWSPTVIQIGEFSAGLWTGERIHGVDSASSLREWEREHCVYDPANDAYAKRKLEERIAEKDEEVKQTARHHVRNLLRIKEKEQRSNYVRDHKPEPAA